MLELKNICMDFKSPNSESIIHLFKNLNLKIEDGEFVTIIGSNGSGKSTTMNIVTGAYTPTSGKVILDGKDVTKMKEFQRAKYIGRVFQDPKMGTASNMSILENLEIAIRRGQRHSPFKWGFKKENKELFTEMLKSFDLGIEERLEKRVGTMSGGQRQALTLLMATLQKPKILLLDEPTAALDPKTARKVLEVTDKVVKENNLTTMMVTHNMKDALKYGNRLIMFKNGKIIFDVKGKEKENLTINDLLDLFEEDE